MAVIYITWDVIVLVMLLEAIIVAWLTRHYIYKKNNLNKEKKC